MDIDYLSIHEKEYIINNKTMKQIADELGVDRGTVSRNFKKLNLISKPRQTKIDYSTININAFDDWSVEMAYWLGFLAADGSIKGNTVSLALKSTDKEHLIKFKKFLNLPDECLRDRDIFHKKTNKTFKQSYILFTSSYVVEKFKKWFIIPSKSYKDVDFLENIKIEYILPFIFGYFDGDGSFSFNLYKSNKSLSLVGNKKTMNSIHNFLVSNYSFNNTKINYDRNIYIISWSSYKDIINFINLYKSTLGFKLPLNRKFLKMNLFLEKISDNVILNSETNNITKKKTNWPSKEELEILIQKESFESIGRTYNVSGKAVTKWCIVYGLPHKVKDIKEKYNLKDKSSYKEPSLEKQKVKYSKTNSGFKAVNVDKKGKKPYVVKLLIDGKYKSLGSFENLNEAAKRADELILKYHGSDAITNKKLGLIDY